MKQLQVYTYTLPALGSVQIPAPNDNFIVLASTGPVSVRGDTFGKMPSLVAGQGLKMVPFNRLELIDESGAPNTVTILLAPVEFVNQVFSGSVNVVGALSLDTPTVNALNRPELPGGNWSFNGTVALNTPLTVFAPGANPNGAIIWTAQAVDVVASTNHQSFLAKASAPTTVVDGDVVAMSLGKAATASGVWMNIDLQRPTRIAPGLGFYFISAFAGTAGMLRQARYTLL